MAGEYKFIIGKKNYELISKPIRNRSGALKIIIEIIKLINFSGTKHYSLLENKGEIIIKIDKMSRIFFEVENKLFSIHFPFKIEEKEGKFKVFEKSYNIEIDSSMLSKIEAIIEESIIDKIDIYEVIELIENPKKEYQYCIEGDELNEIWIIIMKLLTFEIGYLRYDYDEERVNGLVHPINHYDVFIENGTTFKIGLEEKIELDHFIDLLKSDTNCHFIR